MNKKITVLAGDGIGPEVCEAGINVLDVPNGDKRDYDRHVVGSGINATY